MAAGFRDILAWLLGWKSAAPAELATVSQRLTIEGCDDSRLTLEGTDTARMTLEGADDSRMTLETS